MTFDQSLLFEAIVLVAVVLLLAGIFISRRNQPSKEKTQPKVTENIMGTVSKTLARESVTANLPSDAVMLIRDTDSGEWLVEVNNTRYSNLKDIHDDQAARKVLDAISGLQRFIGSIPIAAAPTPMSAPSRSDVRPVSNATANVVGNPKFPALKDSILDQIENVLQRKLLKNPNLVERHIHIGAEPNGSLLIEVDKELYHAPDEVPDQEVRAVIQEAIKDWERA